MNKIAIFFLCFFCFTNILVHSSLGGVAEVYTFSNEVSFIDSIVYKGSIKDSESNLPLEFASVSLLQTSDSAVITSAFTDHNGVFILQSKGHINCFLKVVQLGYSSFKSKNISIEEVSIQKDFGEILLVSSIIKLREVHVEGQQVRVSQNGDTSQFNANAFKTAPDADASDLIRKFPGITNENGVLKVNGEEIKKVLVDGKPFFGDDPNMALKNLPADLIDKIKVFDKLSDQSQLSGFDDGQSSKTLNIISKPGRNTGRFGKLYAGFGTDDTYSAGGNLNFFNGDRRISLIGLFNNINQQNFSQQDILGAMGSPSGAKNQGGSGGGHGGGGSGRMLGNGVPSGNDATNFLVGTQLGITTTNASGINYSDTWYKKIKVSGSYFFNEAQNKNTQNLFRKYVNPQFDFYNESNGIQSKNYNHRANVRLEYNLDSSNTIFLIPKLNFQNNSTKSSLHAFTPNVLSKSITSTKMKGDNWGAALIYNLKFKKTGRTLSINLNNEINNKLSNTDLFAGNFNISSGLDSIINQNIGLNASANYSGGLMYTEPIDSSYQVIFNYSPSYLFSENNKETDNFDFLKNDFIKTDASLSSIYNSFYRVQKAGTGIWMKKNNVMLMAFMSYQHATLTGNTAFPSDIPQMTRSFSDFLPMAILNYKWLQGTNLRVIYRVNMTPPTISQLQTVINNSNPILLTTGNSFLKPDHSHTCIIRYGTSNHEKANGLFLMAFINYTFDYIGNQNIIPVKDTLIAHYLVKKGTQLIQPININGFCNSRLFLTYSLPFSLIKSNLNLTSGFIFNRIPAKINQEINWAQNYNFSEGISVSSNIDENIDFTVSYLGNYTIARNTLQSNANQNYFYHNFAFNLNKIIHQRWVLNTALTQSFYTGLSANYNANYTLCNLAFAYKLFIEKNVEIKFSVFDVFNQNNSITRNVTETYTEDLKSSVLGRYYMFLLTWNLKKFKKSS